MVRCLLLFLLLAGSISIQAQTSSPVIDNYYPLLRNSFIESNAYKTVAFVEQRWRIAGNTGFNESIFYVEKILVNAGFKKEINGEADGPLTYRIETRKMEKPTWEPQDASLTIDGDTTPVLWFATNRNILAINSAANGTGGETAEVIYVGKGELTDFNKKDVKGKIVFGEDNVWPLYDKAIRAGAIGVLAYSMPKYNQPEKYVNSIQFQRIAYQDSARQKWGIVLSYAAKEKLLAALAKGSLRVTVKVASKIYRSDELTIVANARGSFKPNERFVFSAHVQEPGANDNATGVGTLAEMARVTAELIQRKKFLPQRTITFIWGDEIVSTGRYINEDAERAKGIKWGLSLDMVGEDIAKTGGSFLIEKMPDPSAIWTRGNDHHTEWGGSVLTESDMFPHYFNDFLLDRCRQQAKENGWVVNANPFEGGSDHTPFLQAKIPGLLMWHFTDVFYHTDADRIDMVSAPEMRNVGVSGLAAAFTLSAANEQTTLQLIDEILVNATGRLQTEYQLSKAAIQNNFSLQKEQHIVDVWASWYIEAIGKMTEINTMGVTEKIRSGIAKAQEKIRQINKELDELLAK
ncbi:MAG: M28 family peptidase [Ferruginibacter sp.]